MWKLLMRLGTGCWTSHDWISKANARGFWLECRRCGCESPGLELPAPRFRRTQSGNDAAHRIQREGTVGPAEPRFEASLATCPVPAPVQWPVAVASIRAMTDAEVRWLQAWRAMSPHEQAVAERMVAGLTASRVAIQSDAADERSRLPARARERAFARDVPGEEASMAVAQ